MKLMHAIDHGFITHRIRIQKFSHSESEVTFFCVGSVQFCCGKMPSLSVCVCVWVSRSCDRIMSCDAASADRWFTRKFHIHTKYLDVTSKIKQTIRACNIIKVPM